MREKIRIAAPATIDNIIQKILNFFEYIIKLNSKLKYQKSKLFYYNSFRS